MPSNSPPVLREAGASPLTYCGGNSRVNNDRNPRKGERVGGKKGEGNTMNCRVWPREPTFLLETSPCNFLLLNMSLISNCTFIAALMASR